MSKALRLSKQHAAKKSFYSEQSKRMQDENFHSSMPLISVLIDKQLEEYMFRDY